MPGSPHIGHALAVYDECGDVPHHNKDTEGTAEQEHAYIADIAQVFRSEEKRRCAEMSGELAGDGKDQYSPEKQQQLIPAKMEQQELHR